MAFFPTLVRSRRLYYPCPETQFRSVSGFKEATRRRRSQGHRPFPRYLISIKDKQVAHRVKNIQFRPTVAPTPPSLSLARTLTTRVASLCRKLVLILQTPSPLPAMEPTQTSRLPRNLTRPTTTSSIRPTPGRLLPTTQPHHPHRFQPRTITMGLTRLILMVTSKETEVTK